MMTNKLVEYLLNGSKEKILKFTGYDDWKKRLEKVKIMFVEWIGWNSVFMLSNGFIAFLCSQMDLKAFLIVREWFSMD